MATLLAVAVGGPLGAAPAKKTVKPAKLTAAQREKLGDALREAATVGNVTQVQTLLKRGAPVEARDETGGESGATPLFYAIDGHFPAVVQVLLKAGANPNLRPGRTFATLDPKTRFPKYDGFQDFMTGPSPFEIAVQENQIDIMKQLVAAGAKLPAKTDGNLLLSIVVHFKCDAALTWLLERGYKPDVLGEERESPLWYAAFRGNLPAVKLLLRYNADPNFRRKADGDRYEEDSPTPLSVALGENQVEVALELLRGGAKPNLDRKAEQNPLLLSLPLCNLPLTEALIRAGATDPAIPDSSPIQALALKDGEEMEWRTLLLLRKSSFSDEAFADGLRERQKAYEKEVAIAKLLVDSGLGGSTQQKTAALGDAVVRGNLPLAQFLLDNGASARLADSKHRTPLESLIREGSTSDEVAMAGGSGENPLALFSADKATDIALLRLLLERGAAVDTRNRDGLTPLEMAARKGGVAILTELLKYTSGSVLNSRWENLLIQVIRFGRRGMPYRPDFPSYAEVAETWKVHPEIAASEKPQFLKMQKEVLARRTFLSRDRGVRDAQVLKLLIAAGVDPGQRDKAGMNALDWAKKTGHLEAIKLLTAPKD